MTVLVACLLLLGGPAAAYLVQSVEGADGVVRISWPRSEIPFRIDAAGSADLGAETTARILRESFAVWQDVDGSALTFRDEGLSTERTASRRDRVNLLLFDETGDVLDAPPGSGIIAVTRINSDAASGAIFDADIVFNGRDFRFSAEPEAGAVYLRDVAVHEIGHFVGLDHSPLVGSAQTRPTMNPFYFGDGPGEASTLAVDDATGVRVLYPEAAFAATTGIIRGHVTTPEGAPVFGAHVTAQNLDTGDLHSTLTGAEAGRDDGGAYVLRGLPAGSYRLGIEPLPAGLEEGNFSDLFRNLDTDFPAEFLGNTADADDADPVRVAPAATTRGIDFTTGFILPGVPFVRSIDGPGNTPDTEGPYETTFDIVNAERVDVTVDVDGVPSVAAAEQLEDGRFRALLPGQPVGSRVRYRLSAVSETGTRVEHPADGGWIEFDVVGLSGSPLAFAVLRDDGVLGVFDTGTDAEVARVVLGEDPIQVLPAADGRHLFVSNLGSSDISVVDIATFRVVERIVVAAQPLDMALSPDGATLYISNSGASLLTAIDARTFEVRGLVSVGALTDGPYGIAAGDESVWVTNLNGNVVLAITDGRIAARIPVDGGPRSLAFDRLTDRLLVTSFRGGDLTLIDTGTNRISATIPLGVAGTFAVALHPAGGRAYVTAHDEGLVLVVDLSTQQVVAAIDVGADPRGLSLSPDGSRLFVTTAAGGQIRVLDAATYAPLAELDVTGGPRGISVVEAPSAGPVTAIDAEGGLPATWSLSPAWPNPFNPETHVAVTLPFESDVVVEVFDALGQRLRRFERRGVPAGTHRLSWDGRDDRGGAVASGLYFLRLHWQTEQAVRKALLLR